MLFFSRKHLMVIWFKPHFWTVWTRLQIKHIDDIPVFPGFITTFLSTVDRNVISIYLSSFSFQCHHGNNINLLFPDHLPEILCSVWKWTLQHIKYNHDLLPVRPAGWIPKPSTRICFPSSLGFLYTNKYHSQLSSCSSKRMFNLVC